MSVSRTMTPSEAELRRRLAILIDGHVNVARLCHGVVMRRLARGLPRWSEEVCSERRERQAWLTAARAARRALNGGDSLSEARRHEIMSARWNSEAAQ